MSDVVDVVVVGAGAAGLATGIFAASHGAKRVVLLDGMSRVGAKILVAGGGRCTVTHDRVEPADFNAPPRVVARVLAAFDEAKTVEWFRSMGVELKREGTGKLFPTTDDAHTVLNALVGRCEALGVAIRTDHRVTGIRGVGDAFVVTHSQGELAARRVVLATGGRSLPRSGSDGFGYELAKSLGHTVTATHPALAPLVLDDSMFHAAISGVSLAVTLRVYADGKQIDKRDGSLLFTHFGISGPVVMDASRHWVIAKAEGRDARMRCSLLPGLEFAQAESWLLEAGHKNRSVGTVLGQKLPQRLAAAVLTHVGIDGATVMHQLSRDHRRRLVHALTDLALPVLRDRGWNYAEVTAGGVPLKEVDVATMMSRKTAGLYLVGEILDCDGRIGGFNFQWAWATGFLAGKAVGGA